MISGFWVSQYYQVRKYCFFHSINRKLFTDECRMDVSVSSLVQPAHCTLYNGYCNIIGKLNGASVNSLKLLRYQNDIPPKFRGSKLDKNYQTL